MRRRAFAQSVVVTFSLVEPACTSAGSEDRSRTVNPPPPPQRADDGAEIPAKDDGAAAPGDSAGPPDANANDDADPRAPEVMVNPPPPEEIRHRVEVVTRPDGTCWEQVIIDCPPGVACNPPPPKSVDCPETPEAELPAATVAANVDRRDDGTCWESFTVDDCPPTAQCNPPPPAQVRCPPNAD